MLPFVQQQLVYAAASGLVAIHAWYLARAAVNARRHPLLRFALAGALIGGFFPVAFGLLCYVLRLKVSYGFLAVALTFYAGAAWLPALGIGQMIKRSRQGLPAGWAALPLVLLLIGTALYAMLVAPNRLTLREEHLDLKAWDAPEPFRLVHISDLQTVGWGSREKHAAERVNSLEPDLIVITGDYIAGPFWDTRPAIAAARRFLASLHARLGVIAVLGHSEGERERRKIFEGLPVMVLENQEHLFELGSGRRLRIVGLGVKHPDLTLAALPPLPGEVIVVASHVPDVSRDLSGLRVDLHLAGHTHGGQIAIPGFGAPMILSSLPRRFARGLFWFDDHWLNVSAGIGMEGNHAPRVRLNSPPEVCLLLVE